MCDWAEATSDGKKFYYHKITRKSVWEKPEELIQYENAVNNNNINKLTPPWSSPVNTNINQNNQNNTSNLNNNVVTSHNIPKSNINNTNSIWKEYTAKDGRKYYHNTATGATVWDPPPEFQNQSQPQKINLGNSNGNLNNSNNSSNIKNYNNSSTSSTSSITTAAASGTTSSTSFNKSKDDIIRSFIDLLKENDIGTTWTFDRAFRLIANDERYHALKTMTERKQIFADYINDKKRTEIEEKKKREKKNRDDYIALLRETKEITPQTTWRHASLLLDGNPRFESLDTDREREDLFKSYIDEIEKLEKDILLDKKSENMKQLKAKFEESDHITYQTQWRKIKEEYENDPIYQFLDKFDFLSVFQSHIRELEKRQDDLKRIEREKQKREARKDRDAFRELLQEKYSTSELHALTRWKEFKEKVQSTVEFEKVSAQTSGSSPLDIFIDFKEDLERKYEKDYKKLKDIVKEVNFIFIPNQTTLESFREAIMKHEKINMVSPNNYLPFLEYLRYKEETKERSLLKKKKKHQKHFQQLLSSQKLITPESTWTQIRPTIMLEKYFEELDDEGEREKLFNLHLEILKKYQLENPVPMVTTTTTTTTELEDGEEGELIDSPPTDLKKKRNHDYDNNNSRIDYNGVSERNGYDHYYGGYQRSSYDIDDRPYKKDKRR